MTDQNKSKTQLISELNQLRHRNQILEQHVSENKNLQPGTNHGLDYKSILQKTAENLPDSYLSVIEKDYSISFTSGKEFFKQNPDTENSTDLILKQIYADKAALVSKKFKNTFQGNAQSFELFVYGQYQHHRTVPLYADDGSIPRILTIVENVTNRKKAEKALRENEALLSQAQEIGHIGSWILDVPANRLIWTDETYRIFGLQPQEFPATYKAFLDVVHPEDRDKVHQAYSNSLKELNANYEIEHRIIRKDTAQIRFVFEKCVHERDVKGTVIRSIGMVQDITERVQVEQDLRDSEERFRALHNASFGGIAIHDKGIILECNRGLSEMTGYEYNELIGMNGLLLISDDTRDMVIANITAGFEKPYEATCVCKNGDTFPLRLEARNVPYKGKDVRVVEFRDITESKRAAEALAKSERQYRLLADNLSDVIWTRDLNLKLTYVSPSTLPVTGFTVDERMKQSMEETITPESAAKSLKILQEELVNERNQASASRRARTFEVEMYHKNGTTFPAEMTVSFLRNDQGVATGIIGVSRNISARKQAEKEKLYLEEQLRRSQKLETIGTLAGGIAHDFNNILSPILGYADLALLNLKETDPLHKYIEHILNAAYRAKNLVEQILLFAKKSEKERQPLSLQQLVEEALKLLRPSIPSTIEIRQRLDESCPKVLGDATQTHQVIVNLCTNAWQAMEEKGGTLTIELKEETVNAGFTKLHVNLNEGQYARLSFIDTGIGMDAITQERIFEPFYTTKDVDKGTGLGLSVAHGIVQNQSGDILVESEPDKGSSFHVYLPVYLTEQEIIEEVSGEIVGGRESVLVVDDDDMVAKLITMMLEQLGYKVKAFTKSEEALNDFRNHPEIYDLVITDLTMPDMTGLDLSGQLQEIVPGIPVIIMTGYGDSLKEDICRNCGIRKVISKPLSLTDVAKAVRNVLDK